MSMYRSASMYSSPYTWRATPTRIDYPPMFHSVLRMKLCRYAMDSKILAIGVLVLGVAVLVTLVTLILPFWFQLVLDPAQGQFGQEPEIRELTLDTGIFYMHPSEFDNLVFTNKFTGQDSVPKLYIAAHTFAIMGACILFPSFGAGVILMLRKFASLTGLIILATAVTLTALCEVAVIVLCGIMVTMSSCDPYGGGDCKYTDNLAWRLIPMYSQLYRVEPHITPYIKPNWAFYIAIFGPLLCLGAAVVFWIEVRMTYSNLNNIRYQQLRQARDPYENDIDPTVGKKYVYQPPIQSAPGMYGMQPVVHAHTYEGMVLAPAQQGYIPPPAPIGFQPPLPGFQRQAGGPASVGSSTSGQYVSREIDL